MTTHDERTIEAESEVNEKADNLEEGDEVLFGDRKRPLEVVGREEKQITKSHRKRGAVRGHFDIAVLEGNNTTYHLLWQHGTGTEPILRKRSEWTETETEEGETEYDYSAQGTRITSLELVNNE